MENKRMLDLTAADLKEILHEAFRDAMLEDFSKGEETKMVYGLEGIAKLFGCSKTTANKIKQSGAIDEALSQYGHTIVVDSEKAIALLKASSKHRRLAKKLCPEEGR